jgi:CxxC motif-containing protein
MSNFTDQFLDEIRNSKKSEALMVVQRDGLSLRHLTDDMRLDKGVAIAAIKQNPNAFEYVADQLKHDREFVLSAVHADKQGKLLGMVPVKFRNDEDIVLASVRTNGNTLKYASDELKNHKQVVTKAVEQNGSALEFASDSLKDNENLALRAMDNTPSAYKWVSNKLKESVKVLSFLYQKSIGDFFEFKQEGILPQKGFEKFEHSEQNFAYDQGGLVKSLSDLEKMVDSKKLSNHFDANDTLKAIANHKVGNDPVIKESLEYMFKKGNPHFLNRLNTRYPEISETLFNLKKKLQEDNKDIVKKSNNKLSI